MRVVNTWPCLTLSSAFHHVYLGLTPEAMRGIHHSSCDLINVDAPPVTHHTMTHSPTPMTNQDQDDIESTEFTDEELEATSGGHSRLISFEAIEVNH